MTALTEAFVAVRPDMRPFEPELKRGLGNIDTSREGAKVAGKFGNGFSGAMGGVAKRTAGLITAAFATLGAGKFLKDAVGAASDLGETTSKISQIFGPAAKDIQAFASTATTALGQSQQAALDANATFGLFGKSAGLQGKELTGFTTKLTTLASDLASFNNTSPEQAIEAIGAALRGESEPIRSYGVLLDEATLKAEAMALGLVRASKDAGKISAANIRASLAQKKYNEAVKEHGKNSKEAKAAEASLITAKGALAKATEGTLPPLNQQQKVLAAQSSILKQTTVAQGDFARTSGGLANQQRIAAAQTSKLKVAIGSALLPVLTAGAVSLNTKVLPPLIALAEKHGPALGAALLDVSQKAGPFVRDFLDRAGPALAGLRDGSSEASPALASLADSGAKLGPVIQELVAKMPSLTDALTVGASVVGFFADHTDELSKAMPVLVGLIVAYKVAQLAANVAAVLAVPARIAEVVVNRQLVKSNLALIASRKGVAASVLGETAATTANTAAKSAGILTTIRLRAASIAHAVATKAIAVATATWTAAQWLLNVALTANPIGLVIAAAALLAIGFAILWKKSETFRTVVTAAFNGFKSVALSVIKLVWEVVSGFFSDLLRGAAKAFGWVPGIGDKLKTAASEFGKFRDSVNTKLAGIVDQEVKVTPDIKNVTFQGRTVPLNQIGSFGRLAVGGPVRGPGTGTSDTAGLFALSNGEHVWTAEEVRKFGGHDAMERARAGVRGMATGGPVLNVGTPMPSQRGYNTFATEVAAHARAVAKPAALGLATAVVSSLGLAGAAGPPGSRQRFRGVNLNERTIRMLLAAERMLNSVFHITQGSYSTSVSASGSTHAGGGAMDTNSAGRPWGTAVQALRRAGFAAWHRTPAQGPWGNHIHSIAIGDPTASPAALRQVQSFRSGGNGLRGMALGGPVPSYAGGAWNIYNNQRALLHKGEMVVPAKLAGRLRSRWSQMMHRRHLAHLAHKAHVAHQAHLAHREYLRGRWARKAAKFPQRARGRALLPADSDYPRAPRSPRTLPASTDDWSGGGGGGGQVRLHPDDIRALASALGREIRNNPPQLAFDGRLMDERFTRRALAGGY